MANGEPENLDRLIEPIVRDHPDWSGPRILKELIRRNIGIDEGQLRAVQRRKKLLLDRVHLRERLLGRGQVTILLGPRRVDQSAGRALYEGWDLETAFALGQWSDRVKIGRKIESSETADHLLAILEGQPNPLAVGSPRSNRVTEVVLCRLLRIEPEEWFRRPASTAARLPFHFCWPERPDGFESRFELPVEHLPDDLRQKVKAGEGYAVEVNGQFYYAAQQSGGDGGQPTTDYGLVVAGFVFVEEVWQLWTALLGASGLGTWAAAMSLIRGEIELPVPTPDEEIPNRAPSFLYAPVRVDVTWRNEYRHPDPRFPRDPESAGFLLGSPRLWPAN